MLKLLLGAFAFLGRKGLKISVFPPKPLTFVLNVIFVKTLQRAYYV
jgi:hypothetical protein